MGVKGGINDSIKNYSTKVDGWYHYAKIKYQKFKKKQLKWHAGQEISRADYHLEIERISWKFNRVDPSHSSVTHPKIFEYLQIYKYHEDTCTTTQQNEQATLKMNKLGKEFSPTMASNI